MPQDQWLNSLKKQFNENPMGAFAVGTLAVSALARLVSSLSVTRRARIWDREVARRERNTYSQGRRR